MHPQHYRSMPVNHVHPLHLQDFMEPAHVSSHKQMNQQRSKKLQAHLSSSHDNSRNTSQTASARTSFAQACCLQPSYALTCTAARTSRRAAATTPRAPPATWSPQQHHPAAPDQLPPAWSQSAPLRAATRHCWRHQTLQGLNLNPCRQTLLLLLNRRRCQPMIGPSHRPRILTRPAALPGCCYNCYNR